MSLIASRLNLTQRCTIQRDASAPASDDWSPPADPDWQDHLTDQPCRSWASAGSEAVNDSTNVVVVEDARLLLPLGTDVTARDRVTSVTYRGGTVQDGPLGIRAVLTHRDHIELVLVSVG
jgi:hypothetical protein